VSGNYLTLFILRRMGALVLLLLLLSFGIFTLLYLAPGSVEQALLGPHPATPEAVAAIRQQYHLDDPFLVQYLDWLGDALRGDFGTSSQTGEAVRSIIAERIGLTAFLAAYGFLLSLLLGILGGVAAALHQRRPLDRVMVSINVVGVSSPAFATGILLLYVFAVLLGWFPAFGDGDGFADRLQHLTLPAIALALSATALVMKITRAAMIHELEQDYVVFARARGLSWRRVVFLHAFRNALVPIVTAAGLVLGYMLTGAVLVEVTFALAGLGSALVDAVDVKDIAVVQAVTLLFAALIVFVNLLTDIAYLAIDPRIRYRSGG
jgi:peptide/nickel transport system permease protein